MRALFAHPFPQKLSRCDYLVVCHDNDRGYVYEKYAYAQLADTIRENIEAFGLRVAVISTPFSILARKQATGSPVLINRLYFWAIIVAIFLSTFSGSRKVHLATRKFKLWSKLLVKMQPRVVIGIQPCEALCAAGKNLGIPVIDLQHGIIENSIDPNVYYGSRVSWHFGTAGVPDSVLCWDQRSADTIKAIWPFVNTIVSGNPWVQRFLIPSPKDHLVVKEIELLNHKLSKISGKKIVLLTTQWGSTFDGVNIPRAVRDAILLTSSKDVQWCIKFHPVEMRRIKASELPAYAINGLGQKTWDCMIDLSLHSLPAIFRFASFHVTGSSAATFEATFFDIKTGLWDHRPEINTWFNEEITNNHAEFLPRDPLSISSKIQAEALKHIPLQTLRHG